jgi:pimeloyl-ACP methyl ester carboxylesterase
VIEYAKRSNDCLARKLRLELGSIVARMQLVKGQSLIDGVHVEFVKPDESQRKVARPPLILVHGGCDGSWVWRNHLDYYASAGWECYSFSWFNHFESAKLPERVFLNRSIEDVCQEIGIVVSHIQRTPILVGHSMGGMACQKYAEKNDLEGLVLVTSVVPAEVGGPVIEMPVRTDEPWGPPPFDIARELFFQGSPEEDAKRYYSLLCSESPKAVLEATRWTIHIDKKKISNPILVIGAELDNLTPPDVERRLADFYGADYYFVRKKGHNLLLEPNWMKTAGMIQNWLARHCLIISNLPTF